MNHDLSENGRGHFPMAVGIDPEMLDALADASNPLVVLDRIVTQALVLVPAADGAAIELTDGDELVYVCCAGTLSDSVGTRLATSTSFSGLSVSTNQVLLSDDTETDDRVDRQACRRVGAASMVCVPLQRPSGVIGVLKVTSRSILAFAERDLSALQRLAPFITATVGAASELSRVIPALLTCSEAWATGTDTSCPDCDRSETGAVTQFVANVMRPGMVDEVDSRHAIVEALRDESLSIAFQPIYRLSDGALVATEALSRFPGPPVRPPDQWFAAAQKAGLGVELELLAIRRALAFLERLPSGIRLAVNVGPLAAGHPGLRELLDRIDHSRVVLELTEHVEIGDYPVLRKALDHYRSLGIKLAADDTGAGISGLTHILRLAPDYIKLDRELTMGIELDPVRRSLARALVSFASESAAEVVAEGIETAEALEVLTDLGITYGQGYHLGRPGPLEDLDPGRPLPAPSAHTAAV